MAKLKGLGRGLDALLASDDQISTDIDGALTTLRSALLRPNRYQPRPLSLATTGVMLVQVAARSALNREP